jgi:hypothetical protein
LLSCQIISAARFEEPKEMYRLIFCKPKIKKGKSEAIYRPSGSAKINLRETPQLRDISTLTYKLIFILEIHQDIIFVVRLR